MMKTSQQSSPDAETVFLGLVRSHEIADYVGRGAALAEGELRALFAVAQAALRQAQAAAIPASTACETAEQPVVAAPPRQRPRAAPPRRRSTTARRSETQHDA